MATIKISALTSAATAANTDKFLMELAGGGTRQIDRNNLIPGTGAFSLFTATDVDLANDRFWVLDATDGRPREISPRELIFGNYLNIQETDDFTLLPNTHNLRSVELGEALPDVVSTITLDGGQTGIGGCDFYLVNTRNASITVNATGGITMFVDGAASSGTIRARRSAAITVTNAGTEAIFEGG